MDSPTPPMDGLLRTFMQTKVTYQGAPAAEPLRWRLARRLESLLAPVPGACLQDLVEAGGGHIVFSEAADHYVAQQTVLDDRPVTGVAMVNGPVFLEDALSGLRIIARLVNHYLGSRFQSDRLISDTAPGVEGWDGFHRRLATAHAAGYADNAEARSAVSAYFEWAFAVYLLDRRYLSHTDPSAYRLLHSELLSEAFWRGHPRRPRPESGAIVCQ